MTDPPILVPNARHQAQVSSSKTGLASLPPKPVFASQARTILARSYQASEIEQSPSGNIAEMVGEAGSTTSKAKDEGTPSGIPGSSSSSRTSTTDGATPSSTALVTPSSRVLGKRPFVDSTEPGPSTMIQDQSRIIPILPTPLPSKRFKKGSQARASLVPVEQLPVFPLPPLPVISDPALEKQVFTHQSCFPRRKWRFEDPEDDPSLDYEKLEHVGDSILGMVVTTWLHELKPRLTCGKASVS
jgi:hypothetical protein